KRKADGRRIHAEARFGATHLDGRSAGSGSASCAPAWLRSTGQGRRWEVGAAEAGNVVAVGWGGDLSEGTGDPPRRGALMATASRARLRQQLLHVGEAALRATEYAQPRTWFEQAAAAGGEQGAQRLTQLAQHGL